jgi:hypothetical protein
MTGPRWDVSNGEGTGQYVELRVLVSVGSEGCKVVVEHSRGAPAHVQVAGHDEASRVAGDVVRHLVEQSVAGFLKSTC